MFGIFLQNIFPKIESNFSYWVRLFLFQNRLQLLNPGRLSILISRYFHTLYLLFRLLLSLLNLFLLLNKARMNAEAAYQYFLILGHQLYQMAKLVGGGGVDNNMLDIM